MRRARLGKGGGGGGKNGRFSHFFLLNDFPPPSQEPGTGYDGGGSENVTLNWIPRFFFFFFSNFFAFLSNSLTVSVFVSFPAVNFLRTIPIVQKREKTTCRKSKFHVLRACLHGLGNPGLVGLVSFVFTLWGTQNKRNLPHSTGVPHSI